MTLIEQLLSLATLYGEAEGVKASTVSWRVFGDAKKLDAISEGADLQTRRYEAALDWFAAHWPVGLDWPETIERPKAEAA